MGQWSLLLPSCKYRINVWAFVIDFGVRYIFFNVLYPFSSVTGAYLDLTTLTQTTVDLYRTGRLSIMIMTVAYCILIQGLITSSNFGISLTHCSKVLG